MNGAIFVPFKIKTVILFSNFLFSEEIGSAVSKFGDKINLPTIHDYFDAIVNTRVC